MRRLMLLRHAKSDWSAAGSHDHDRQLNQRGRKAAPTVAAYMTRNALIPDRVICARPPSAPARPAICSRPALPSPPRGRFRASGSTSAVPESILAADRGDLRVPQHRCLSSAIIRACSRPPCCSSRQAMSKSASASTRNFRRRACRHRYCRRRLAQDRTRMAAVSTASSRPSCWRPRSTSAQVYARAAFYARGHFVADVPDKCIRNVRAM